MLRLFVIAVSALLLGGAQAHDFKAGSIDILHPWSRATPPGAKVAAGYVTLVNRGAQADRLLGGAVAGAARVELHRMSMENGVMRMRPMTGGVTLAPGETVEFKPNGPHLMFVGLAQGLKQGERVRGTLQFEKSGTVEVEFTVEAIGGSPAAPTSHGH
jgi:copper(I)-binding protein